MHICHWSFSRYIAAMSDENDETLLAPETLDYRSSIPINLHNDKDDDTFAASEMLECASTTPTGIL